MTSATRVPALVTCEFYSQHSVQILHALPGVLAATEISALPPFGGLRSDVEIVGQPQTEQRFALFQLCSEGYFRTLGSRLIRGRLLSKDDVTGARRVGVVNQTLLNKFF